MSIAEIERFAADLQSNTALRAEAEKHAAEKQHETLLAGAVAFAASKGYAFTADEMKEHAKAKAAGKELTDAELDKVAGGYGAMQVVSEGPQDAPLNGRPDLTF